MDVQAPPPARRRRTETGGQILARRRRGNARHQRDLRDRRAAAGQPDPDLLDRAIVAALRDAILAAPVGSRLTTAILPEGVVVAVGRALMARSAKAQTEGGHGPVYDARAVADALQNRLLKPGRRALTL